MSVHRYILPTEGDFIDTTVEPMTINVRIQGITISLPLDEETKAELQKRPGKSRLVLEMIQ